MHIRSFHILLIHANIFCECIKSNKSPHWQVLAGSPKCNGQVLVESEVKIKEKPQTGIVLFSSILFCILQKHLPFSHGHTCMSFQFSDAIVSHDNDDNF